VADTEDMGPIAFALREHVAGMMDDYLRAPARVVVDALATQLSNSCPCFGHHLLRQLWTLMSVGATLPVVQPTKAEIEALPSVVDVVALAMATTDAVIADEEAAMVVQLPVAMIMQASSDACAKSERAIREAAYHAAAWKGLIPYTAKSYLEDVKDDDTDARLVRVLEISPHEVDRELLGWWLSRGVDAGRMH